MIILKGSETRADIFVNEENIVLAERKEPHTYVVFKQGATALVDETPQEIQTLIRLEWGG